MASEEEMLFQHPPFLHQAACSGLAEKIHSVPSTFEIHERKLFVPMILEFVKYHAH